jgi:hypothetical protein
VFLSKEKWKFLTIEVKNFQRIHLPTFKVGSLLRFFYKRGMALPPAPFYGAGLRA